MPADKSGLIKIGLLAGGAWAVWEFFLKDKFVPSTVVTVAPATGIVPTTGAASSPTAPVVVGSSSGAVPAGTSAVPSDAILIQAATFPDKAALAGGYLLTGDQWNWYRSHGLSQYTIPGTPAPATLDVFPAGNRGFQMTAADYHVRLAGAAQAAGLTVTLTGLGALNWYAIDWANRWRT